MLRLNEEKVFVDRVDEQMVALMVETGTYYTFNTPASAVISDLSDGYTEAAVAEAFAKAAGERFRKEEYDAFVQKVIACGVLEEADGEGKAADAHMACLNTKIPEDGNLLEMEGYDDVAAYFMVDPIHEVDPDMGWPYAKKDEEA